MIRQLLAGGLLGSIALVYPVQAVEVGDFELQTTQDLVDVCSADPDGSLGPEAQQACYGYIAGTIHFYSSLVAGGDRFKPIVCPDRELTRQEVAELLVDWAKDNPDHMQALPVEGVLRAAVATYPCPAEATAQ
jgi:hypothetical protein